MKRFLAALLAAVLLLSTVTTVSAANVTYVTNLYYDVYLNDWYAPYIQHAYDLGLMSGMSEHTFSPTTAATRGMFVQILYAAAGRPSVEGMTNPFWDNRDGAWYHDAVVWAYNTGIVSGTDEGVFSPDNEITREQTAVILYNLQGKPSTSGSLSSFLDPWAVHDWAYYAMCWAVENGIVSGISTAEGLYLNPTRGITRAETATVLTGFYSKFYGMTDTTTLPSPLTTPISTSSIKNGVTLPVLMYHEVADQTWGIPYLFVRPSTMRQQLKYLKDHGYQTIFLSDLDHLSDYSKPVILTFDDGYEGNYTNLFPLLKEFNMKATIFLVTDSIGKTNRLTKAEIKEMAASGLVSFQSHTVDHTKLSGLSTSQLKTEFANSKQAIANITGCYPYAVSYPEGDISDNAKQVASQYYTFGLLATGGTWTTNRGDRYNITRSVINRDISLSDFADRLTASSN